MTRPTLLLLAATLASAPSLTAQSRAPLIGRWDMTVAVPGRHTSAWLEIRHSGRSMLVGEVMLLAGSARPIAKAEFTPATGEFRFVIPPQWNDAEGDNTFVGRVVGDSINGTVSFGNGKPMEFRGVRAPTLRRTAPVVWGAPIALLGGTTLSEWKPLGESPSQWALADGILRNAKAGADLVTTRSFGDFKLHVEFRYPAGSNSGVYLRGRYEVQIEDTPSAEPQIDGLGAIYGMITPNQNAAKKPGEWQTFDITLIGRTVTVVLNGKTIICEREIPGFTGGALDPDEAKPGPIYLQGDHGVIEYRRIIITPAK
jgi:hypothetical protein